jgi:hypothetical protein
MKLLNLFLSRLNKKGPARLRGRARSIQFSEASAEFTGSPVPGFHRDLTSSSVCLRVMVGLRPTHSCA